VIHRTSKEPLTDRPSMMSHLWEAIDHKAKLWARVRRESSHRDPAMTIRSSLSFNAFRTYSEHVYALGRAVRHRAERRISHELRELFRGI
jgi:hypothetical protein